MRPIPLVPAPRPAIEGRCRASPIVCPTATGLSRRAAA